MPDSDKIINLAVAAHVDAGKTTITEQILCLCGVIRKAGSVDDGTTATDRMEVERERGISVKAAVTTLEYKGVTLNLIDTPGHADFAGEVERVLGALDGAVLVVSAVEGVQSHTINLHNAFKKLHIPTIVFINKIDRAGADFARTLDMLKSEFGDGFVPFNRSDREGGRDCAVKAVADDELFASLAEYDDSLARLWLDGKSPAPGEIYSAAAEAVAEERVTPVLCGAAQLGIGCGELLDAITRLLPRASRKSVNELSAYIFKLEHDHDIGKIAYVRMFGGAIKNRDMIYENEKVTQIRKWSGAKYFDVGEVSDGDIAALCGLESAKANAVIGSCAVSETYRLANPFLTVRVTPADSAALSELVAAARELSEEDPLINYRWEKTEREVNIDLTGQIQLEIISELLKKRYGLDTVISPPSVIYKETPASYGEGYEAYTMPKPCWAVVKLGLTPLPRGSGVQYDGGHVEHNKLFYKYQTHIKTSVFDSLEQGLYGWEMTDMLVTLLDGEHHTIHTHPLDFFVATPMALMYALENAGSTLLEPLIKARITAGEEFLGKVVSDITNMRGEFDTPSMKPGRFTMEAILPVSTSLDYPIKLASMTSGRALYSSDFYGYRACPLELGATAKRRGIDPRDSAKWILHARGAY